jgi:transcriptional regulator with XRE-family HTH domain
VRYECQRPEDLGTAIVEFRTRAGITQAETAERVSMNRTYLSNVEQGEVPIYIERYFDLLKSLGLTIKIENS